MKISAIIPAYNVEKYIARSISSALNQTFPPFEIIIIDDGSTDNTGNIVKGFGREVKYFYQENRGSSSARNLGIEKAKGEWIAFLDSDDEWRESHLENFRKIIVNNSRLKWYGCPANLYNSEDKKIISEYKKKYGNQIIDDSYFPDYLSALPPYAFFSSPTMVIHRSVFEEIGFFDVGKKTAEDIDMWYRIGLIYPEIGYSHEVGANVYRRNNSLSFSKIWKPNETLSRLMKWEAMALEMGQEFALRAEPRLILWVKRHIKKAFLRRDQKALREIKEKYFNRLPANYRFLLVTGIIVSMTKKIV